jgi:hypothetical protein
MCQVLEQAPGTKPGVAIAREISLNARSRAPIGNGKTDKLTFDLPRSGARAIIGKAK